MPDKHKLSESEQEAMVTEMKQMEYEPLLPVEKKLITYSIGLGIALLFVFIWMSRTFFNVTTLEKPTADVKAASGAAAPAVPGAPAGAAPAQEKKQ